MAADAVIVGYGSILPQGQARSGLDRVLAGEGAATVWEEDPRLLVGRVPAGLVEERPGEDRAVALALRAAELAMADAGELGVAGERFACLFTVSKGGLASFGHLFSKTTATAGGKRHLTLSGQGSTYLTGLDPAAAARAVAERFGLRGAALALVSACSSGGHLLAAARAMIVSGRAEAVICGAADASLLSILLASYDRLGLLVHAGEAVDRGQWSVVSNNNSNGRGGMRPALTSSYRNGDGGGGFFVGEGAAAFVVTSAEWAKKKGRPVVARVAGSAAGSQAMSLVDMATDGVDLAHVCELALARAGLRPEEVDVVMVHGTATRAGERNEAAAVGRVFGTTRLPAVVGTKRLHGHLLGAACAAETAVLLRGMEAGRGWRVALKISAGFGGHISANVLVR
jgi:3-oxoacyl-(acyl-carrier-protein) synthase